VFLCCLFFLTLTDLEEMVIPDECHVISVTVWVLALSFTGDTLRDGCLKILSGILAGGFLLAVSLILDRVLGKESLGGGDIKLLAVTGLYLGPVGTLFALMISCILGLMLRGAVSAQGKAFHFGPFLATGEGAMLLFGDPLVRWYTGFLGM
jgi:leader peptidase (prepilin peptidase)/N-methyltransferase